MEAALLILIIPFLIFAAVLSKGKGAFLLSGYNTLPDSEKAQYNEAALCKFIGKIMYGISFSLLLLALGEIVEKPILFLIGLVFFLTVVMFALVYVNTGNRFKKTG
ncbi:DUF3784 domain-containing protein [Domibacillus indicus]|uniref:DUF3784 domain-containing protein n=1 Tax=Domibacillus indicus TaxID=1437523 RepID=UPI000617EDFD|nr:DUF3784 domain-containing protein [Domibacillus indicus]